MGQSHLSSSPDGYRGGEREEERWVVKARDDKWVQEEWEQEERSKSAASMLHLRVEGRFPGILCSAS